VLVFAMERSSERIAWAGFVFWVITLVVIFVLLSKDPEFGLLGSVIGTIYFGGVSGFLAVAWRISSATG
jgi:hypothetical protein